MPNLSFKWVALSTLGLAALAAFAWAGSPVGISATGQRDTPIVSVSSAGETTGTPVAPPATPEATAVEPEAVPVEPEAAAPETSEVPPVPTPPPGLDMSADEAVAEEESAIANYETRGREAGKRHKRAVLAALSGAWVGMKSSWTVVADTTGGAWLVTRAASADAWRATRDMSAEAWRATRDASADAWRYTRKAVEGTWPEL